MRLSERLVLITAIALLTCTVAAAPAADGIDAKVDSALRKELLNKIAVELESKYVIAETARKLAALLRSRQKANAYKNITSKLELARALTDDMFTVAQDKHLSVFISFARLPAATADAPSAQDLERMRKENGAISKLEVLDGNVGYLCVNGLPSVEGAGPAVAAAFAFLHNTDALILDNRGNNGGDANTAILYESYLSEGRPHLAFSFHYREENRVKEFWTTDLGELAYGASKPVFVLTSSRTFSGGEGVAYNLQALKRAVIVGETTAGGATSPLHVELGHHFALAVPVATGVNPITGTSWEGVGVKPDVPVDASGALNNAHTLAIENLRASAADESERSDFDSILMKLQSIEEAGSASTVRLSNADVVGSYVPVIGMGTTVVIFEKDGELIWHVDGLQERALIFLGGNRYARKGLPSGFTISFRAKSDNTELLMEDPIRPSVIRVKQTPRE